MSQDGTREFLESHIQGGQRGTLLSQNGSGLYQAFNQGIDFAIGNSKVTHVGMLHSDDRLITSAFEKYLAVIDSVQSEVFYSSIDFHNDSENRVRVWETGEFSRFKRNTGWMPHIQA